MTEKLVSCQFVIFTVNGQLCALTIDEVVEIIEIPTITEVSGTKTFISGIINLRGNIIPVISLRKRYGMPIVPFTKKNRILVIQNNGEKVGLIVDEVLMITFVEKSNIEPTQEIFAYIEKECYQGFVKVGELLIGIFKTKQILYPK